MEPTKIVFTEEQLSNLLEDLLNLPEENAIQDNILPTDFSGVGRASASQEANTTQGYGAVADALPQMDWESPDGSLYCHGIEAEGNIILSFEVAKGAEEDWEGKELTLQSGSWERRVILEGEPIGDQYQVGAEVVISQEERKGIPADGKLLVIPSPD